MITRYGFALMISGLAAAALGRVFGVIELYVLAAGLVVLPFLAALTVLLSRPRLRMTRIITPSRIFVNESARVDLVVHNVGWHTSPVVRLNDPVAGTIGAQLSVTPLRPRRDARATYRLPSERRGRLEIGPMRMQRRDPFGLASRIRVVAPVAGVLVHPSWQPLDFPDRWAGSGPLALLIRRRLLARQTEEFHSLRTYVPGDDLRRVHWKQSARSEELKIKQTDPEAVQRVGILLDVAAEQHTAESFEAAVSAAASFALSAERAGFKVHATTSAVGDSPAADIDEFLDTLALAATAPSRPLSDAINDVTRWLEGGMVVVITGRSHPDALAALRNSSPGADAGVLVLCEAAAASQLADGFIRGGFVMDGSRPDALVRSWTRLIGPGAA
jgi:hypothetical protein